MYFHLAKIQLRKLFCLGSSLNNILMKCYYCDVEITEANKSEEHIFPDFTGGKLTSYDLLCRSCNSMLGSSIDAELSRQIMPYTDLLITSRRRKKKKVSISLVHATGERIRISKNLTPYAKLYLETPNAKITLYAENFKELKKLAEKKIKEMGGTEKIKVEYFEEPPPTELAYFENHLSRNPGEIGFGGREFMKAICKIAINYSLFVRKNREEIAPALEFLRTNHKINETVAFFFPPPKYEVHDLGVDEVSNLIYLKGDKDLGVLYCYIEILNFQNFIVILNMEYKGEEFSNIYCHDIRKNQELNKHINLKMHREEFQILNLIGSSHLVGHKRKVDRLNQILEKLQE
jgi:hypothetical protein